MLFLLQQNFRKKDCDLANMLKPHLLTYPRCGSHYLDDLIYKEVKVSIEKSHSVTRCFDKNNNKQRTIVTIVRDPVETLYSYIALAESRSPHAATVGVDQVLTEYILLHSFLYEHADYVIDFKDLIEHPDAVTKKIVELLGINEETSSLFHRNPIVKHSSYLESSKNLPGYKRHDLERYNIDLCYFHYNRLLERKIVI